MVPSNEKRHFSRVLFDSTVKLSGRDKTFQSSLIDLSLHGALVTIPADWQGQVGDPITLDLVLSGDGTEIRMDTTVAHMEPDHIGLKTEHIDIDSITHLRRLIELNLGDPEELDRELGELVHVND
jgi:hypothetical protein